ncbi:hypothetical protein GCM10012275_54530 [Longimycelium tulufanense]|uniref:Uncharacterized protein n=1 Tax=Longimycelium tulufanense TaxID=907463 RepID=A0A8J3FXV7_9PSEU|nr:hypothetical protein [Longimycelium tulufanense]GGM76955.1 hypothetical protein GCM10012275_54530 [Longimycelium tulufanense]
MPRTDLTVKTVSSSTPIPDMLGSTTAVDAANGMQFVYTGGKRTLVVNNASAGSITVTIPTPSGAGLDGLDVPDRIVTVDAGKLAVIREFATALQSDGKVYVDFSASTSVTAVVVEDT